MNSISKRATLEYIMPENLQSTGQSRLYFHAFGNYGQDVLFDFDSHNRPRLITSLLTHCCISSEAGEELFWALPLNQRLKILLLVSFEKKHSLIMTRRCGQCREIMEIPFSVDELINLIDENNQEQTEIVLGKESLILKRPCGVHQQEWQSQEFKTEQAAIIGMIRSLNISEVAPSFWDEHLDQKLIEKIDSRMKEFDPMIHFSFNTACPVCGTNQEIMADWEEECLMHLKHRQAQLLNAVHQLARYYGWREKEILDLPVWRRQHYLNLIKAGKS